MTSRIVTYTDSAASDHFFVKQSNFTTYTANTDCKGTAVAGAFPILGTGNVYKSTTYKGQRIEVMFENALHAPSLTHNLVSISCLDVSGKYILFGGGIGTFHDKNGFTFMSGHHIGTMYELTLEPPTSDALAAQSQNNLPTLRPGIVA
jgi:hypothetical protein